MATHQLGMFSAWLVHHLWFFFAVAFNLGASLCVAGPSKTRYSNITSHNPAGIVGLSCLTRIFNLFAVLLWALAPSRRKQRRRRPPRGKIPVRSPGQRRRGSQLWRRL